MTTILDHKIQATTAYHQAVLATIRRIPTTHELNEMQRILDKMAPIEGSYDPLALYYMAAIKILEQRLSKSPAAGDE